TAIGSATMREPAATVPASPSAGATALTADLRHHVEQRRVLHLAERAGGDAALPVDHERGRDRRGRHGARERERDLARLVEEAGVAELLAALEGERVGLAVLEVDAEERHTLGLGAGRDVLERRGLAAAGGAPGRPEVEHHHLAAVVG